MTSNEVFSDRKATPMFLDRQVLLKVITWSDGPPTYTGFVRGNNDRGAELWRLTFEEHSALNRNGQVIPVRVSYGSDGKPVTMMIDQHTLTVRHAIEFRTPPIPESDRVQLSTTCALPAGFETSARVFLKNRERIAWCGVPGPQATYGAVAMFTIPLLLLIWFGVVWGQMFWIGVRTAPPAFQVFVYLVFVPGFLIVYYGLLGCAQFISRAVQLKKRTLYLITTHRALVVISDPTPKVIEYHPVDIYFAQLIKGRRRQRVLFPSSEDGEGNFWSISSNVGLEQLLGIPLARLTSDSET
jgi:hypothetical protein